MLEIPKIGYGIGTAWYKSNPGDIDRACVDAIKQALDIGYTLIDAAQVYNTEEELGVALQEHKIARDDVWITTKLCGPPGPSNMNDVVGSLRTSLEKMKLEYVDLFLIHWPFWDHQGKAKLEDVWLGMEECKDLGLSRHIGVSNFLAPDIERILKVAKSPVYANQLEMHPYCQEPALHDLMRKHDIRAQSYAPLAPLVHKRDGPLTDVAQQLAKKYKRTDGQILLRWNLQAGNILVTTSSKAERMREQLEIVGFELDQEDFDLIATTGRQVQYRKYWNAEIDASRK